MEKWEAEIKDILAQSKWESQENFGQLLDKIMPIIMNMMVLAHGSMVVHSPEGRERIREVLAKQGLTPQQIEQAIYWMIENTTEPLEGIG